MGGPGIVAPRPWTSSIRAAAGLGAVAAAVAAAAVTVSPVWAVLLLAGLAIAIGSLLARPWKHYWLAVFLATIPFNVTKLLFYEPEDVAALKRHYGILVNENLVPQLYLADLPFLVLLAIWAGEILARKSRLQVPREALLAVAFVGWGLFTLHGAPAPFLGLMWALYEIKVILVLLWLVNASLSRSSLRLVLSTIVVTLALQSAITIANYRWQIGPSLLSGLFGVTQTRLEARQGPARGTGTDYVHEKGALLRGTGTVGVGNAQAKFFVSVLPLALASFLVAAPGLARAFALASFVLGFVALYLTYSRGGLLTGLFGTAVFLFLRYRAGHIGRRAFVFLAVGGGLAVASSVPFLYEYLTSRPGYFRARLDHVREGFRIAAEHPLFGVGVNNFNVAVQGMDREGVFATMPIHNHYLRLFIETGALGLALHLGFLLLVVRHAYRLIRAPDPFLATTAMALLAGVLAILVYWSDDIFYDVIIRTQFWVMLGLIFVVRRLAAEDGGGARETR